MWTPLTLVRSIDDELHALVRGTLGPGDEDPWKSRSVHMLLIRAFGLTMAFTAVVAIVTALIGSVWLGITLITS
ncbi:MAG: hypothetical protein KF809_03090 [Chloroflexi bacterium]|nr:hypothetical protein [Chloroflexota bacterium]